MIKKGDKVKIVNCAEAKKYENIVFVATSDPWLLEHGEELIRITSSEKDILGGFSTRCLQKVD